MFNDLRTNLKIKLSMKAGVKGQGRERTERGSQHIAGFGKELK